MQVFNESQWPKDLAIKIVKGNGSAQLAVFEDPNCHFCQEFDRQTVPQLNNVTIYVFLWPFLGDDSVKKAEAILGSPDPATAFTKWMVDGVMPEGKPTQAGQDTIQKISKLADDLNLQGTPSVFLADGKGPFGVMSPSQLTKLMTEKS